MAQIRTKATFFCPACGWTGKDPSIGEVISTRKAYLACPHCAAEVGKQAPDPYANYPTMPAIYTPDWAAMRQQEALDKIKFREGGPLDMQAIFGKYFTVLQRTYHATTDVYVVILKNVETGNTLHVFMYELDDEWHVSHVDRLIRSKDIV